MSKCGVYTWERDFRWAEQEVRGQGKMGRSAPMSGEERDRGSGQEFPEWQSPDPGQHHRRAVK